MRAARLNGTTFKTASASFVRVLMRGRDRIGRKTRVRAGLNGHSGAVYSTFLVFGEFEPSVHHSKSRAHGQWHLRILTFQYRKSTGSQVSKTPAGDISSTFCTLMVTLTAEQTIDMPILWYEEVATSSDCNSIVL